MNKYVELKMNHIFLEKNQQTMNLYFFVNDISKKNRLYPFDILI